MNLLQKRYLKMSKRMKAGIQRLQNMSSYDALVESAANDDKIFTLDRIGPKSTEVEIAISDLHPFKDHPFKVVDDEAMQSLADSIKNRGVLHPIVVRKDPTGGYEIISGHRRRFACIKAGLSNIPAYVVNLSDDEATILMADANFYQREGLLPSEKAKAYRMKSDAIKRHQGLAKDKHTIEEIGEGTNDSSTQIKRFIRLSYLQDDLLSMVDDKKIGIDQGVQFSYLDFRKQEILYATISELIQGAPLKISIQLAKEVREAANSTSFSKELLYSIFLKKEPKRRKYVLKEDVIVRYFDSDTTDDEIEEIITKALSMYFDKEGGVA